MKKCLALLLTAALLLAALPLALGEEIAYTGTVTGGKLHLRKTPAANGKIINTYNQGTQVEILENDGDWCKVRVGTKEGYMMTQYLSIQANYTHLAWAATPRDGGVLTLFESPEEKGSIVLQCMSGAVFEVTAREGDFSQVRAGDQFAYLPTAALTELSGEFTQGVTAQAEGGLTLAALKNARKEVGAPISRSQSEGNFAYSFSYPELSLQAADEKIAAWLERTLAVFQADHAAHHPQERGDYTVVYQAVQADERYAGVVLMGEYTAGDTRLQAFLALNLDLDAQRVLAPEELFADLTGPLFMLESEAGAYMTMASEGYSGRPDAGWLEYAALTDEGLEVYLPAGLFMPLSAGTRRITLKYRQIAGAMALDSAFIQGQARTIDPTRPMIALTFDDGPSEQTAKILDVLAQYDARATFCIRAAHARGMHIILNPSPISPELLTWPLELVEWFILNEIEGKDITGETQPQAILDELLRRYPACHVVLTLGEHGSIYADATQRIYQGIVATHAVDTTAAGDTFTGYFIHALLKGEGVQQALKTAACASAITVSRPGAGRSIPTAEEVRAAMKGARQG